MIEEYDDIINLPAHVSRKRPQMPIKARAAQFSPFAALRGHEEAVQETARITEKKIELDPYIKEEINRKLQIIVENIGKRPRIKIRYFKADESKDGGAYIWASGLVEKIDEYKKAVLMESGRTILMDDIIELEGEIFKHS